MEERKMVNLKIWHQYKHDDFGTYELEFEELSEATEAISNMRREGGFVKYNDEEPNGYVPWHRINYFEIEEVSE